MWRQHGSRIRVLITEPYLGGGGSFHPQPEYLQLLERFCREHDIVFILDEMQANFGRTGPMFAFTHYGIEPDIVVLGKGLGNGVPVGAVGGPGRSLRHRSITAKAPTPGAAIRLAAAAVLATLDEFESTDVLQRGAAAGRRFARGTRTIGSSCPPWPMCAAKEWSGASNSPPIGERSAAEVARAAVAACYLGDDRGRAIHLLGPLAGTVVRVAPPLIMPPDEPESISMRCTAFCATGMKHSLASAASSSAHAREYRSSMPRTAPSLSSKCRRGG